MASNTLTNTKITETYVGVLHSNGAVLPSTGQQDIYDGGGNKSSIKIGRACNGVTICGPLSCSSIAIGNPTLLINLLYPINSIFLSTDATNPGTRFIGTLWSQISRGRFLAGEGTGSDGVNSYTVGLSNFNGEYRHTLSVSEMPSHKHTGYGVVRGSNGTALGTFTNPYIIGKGILVHEGDGHTGKTATSDTTAKLDSELRIDYNGNSQSHNNVPPGFGIYVWKRTA